MKGFTRAAAWILMILAPVVTARAADRPVPEILRADADSTLSNLFIYGVNFGTREPIVTLSGTPLSVAGFTSTEIVALLPSPIDAATLKRQVATTDLDRGRQTPHLRAVRGHARRRRSSRARRSERPGRRGRCDRCLRSRGPARPPRGDGRKRCTRRSRTAGRSGSRRTSGTHKVIREPRDLPVRRGLPPSSPPVRAVRSRSRRRTSTPAFAASTSRRGTYLLVASLRLENFTEAFLFDKLARIGGERDSPWGDARAVPGRSLGADRRVQSRPDARHGRERDRALRRG